MEPLLQQGPRGRECRAQARSCGMYSLARREWRTPAIMEPLLQQGPWQVCVCRDAERLKTW